MTSGSSLSLWGRRIRVLAGIEEDARRWEVYPENLFFFAISYLGNGIGIVVARWNLWLP